MEQLEFVRHYFQGKRIVSANNDIFKEELGDGEFYQDVLTFSSMEEGHYSAYTVGKHLFPKGNDLTISMQRWMVFFVSDGSLWCGPTQLKKGDFIVIPSSCSQGFMTKSESVKFYWFSTNDTYHIDAMLNKGYLENEIILGHIDNMDTVVGIFDGMLYQFPSKCDVRLYASGCISCVVSFIMAISTKKQKISDQLLRYCLSLIDGMHGAVTVDKLAKKCFISRRYLYTLFKEYKNVSPVEYIFNVRMQSADRFLTNTDYSISKVAELVGYSDYSHFTRAFTKYYSVSPTQRRKQTRLNSYKSEAKSDTDADNTKE